LALLNSTLLSFYKTKNSGSAKKDDFTQITLSDIRQLPIPIVDDIMQLPIVKLVDDILEAKKTNQETKDKETQIDQLVYQMYGLTEEEIKIVEGEK
jgi:type II restriction/modification system DNA methylase subunit YeeA